MDCLDYRELMPGALASVTNFVNVTAEDKVLIITDKPVIAEALAEATKEVGAEVMVFYLPYVMRPVRKLSEPLKTLILGSTVVFTPFDVKEGEFSFRSEIVALDKEGEGRKIAHMPSVTPAMFTGIGMLALNSAEMHKMETLTESLAILLSAAKTARIRSPLHQDTDLSLHLGGWSRSGIVSTGHITKGSWGNLPSGEAFVLPERGSATGTIVIDMGISEVPSSELPITLQVSSGMVERDSIRNGPTLKKLLDNYPGDDVRMVCEFGVGTNPKHSFTLSPIEIEKILRTVHIGIGNNAMFGGDIKAPVPHTDMVISRPTITVDNLQSTGAVNIIEEGTIREDRINAFFKIHYMSFTAPAMEGSAIVKVAPQISVEDEGNKMYRCWIDHRGYKLRVMVGDDDTAKKVRDLWACIDPKRQETVQNILAKFIKKFGGESTLPCQLLNALKQFGILEIATPIVPPKEV